MPTWCWRVDLCVQQEVWPPMGLGASERGMDQVLPTWSGGSVIRWCTRRGGGRICWQGACEWGRFWTDDEASAWGRGCLIATCTSPRSTGRLAQRNLCSLCTRWQLQPNRHLRILAQQDLNVPWSSSNVETIPCLPCIWRRDRASLYCSWKTAWWSQEKDNGQDTGKHSQGRYKYQTAYLWCRRSLPWWWRHLQEAKVGEQEEVSDWSVLCGGDGSDRLAKHCRGGCTFC